MTWSSVAVDNRDLEPAMPCVPQDVTVVANTLLLYHFVEVCIALNNGCDSVIVSYHNMKFIGFISSYREKMESKGRGN